MWSLVVCSLAVLSGALPGEAHYLEGARAERQGHWVEAAAAFKAAEAADPILKPFAVIRHAWALHRQGKHGEALKALESVETDYGDGPWTHMARGYLARALRDLGRHDDAATHYLSVLEERPHLWWLDAWFPEAAANKLATTSLLMEGYGMLAQYVIDTGAVRPRLEASRILARSPEPEHRAAALLGMLRSSAITEAAPVALTAPAVINLANGHRLGLTESLTSVAASESENGMQLEEALERYPETPWLRAWLAWAVRGEARGGNTSGALRAAELLARYYPDNRDTGDALWWLAMHLKDSDPQTTLSLWQKLADSSPNHFRADDSLYAIGQWYEENNQRVRAEEAYELLAERFPDSRFAPEAFYHCALLEQKAGNKEKALAYWKKAAENGMGNFYSHRALERLAAEGAPSQASSRNLKIDGHQSVIRAYQLPESVLSVPPLPEAWAESSALKRIRFFARHGLEESEWEALFLLDIMRENSDVEAQYRSLAEAGLAHSALETAANRGWGAFPKGEKSAARWRLEFPRAYWPLFLTIAQETGLDPYLLMALSKQESTFRPNLTSHAGASGVMQLMPATAKWMADVDPNISANHVENLESPINSIRLGAFYMKRMLDRSNGNLIFALASYNAGPGNCDKWRARWPNASPEEFMERIPFRETNDYVKKVLGNYAAYHSLYPAVDWEKMSYEEALAAWN